MKLALEKSSGLTALVSCLVPDESCTNSRRQLVDCAHDQDQGDYDEGYFLPIVYANPVDEPEADASATNGAQNGRGAGVVFEEIEVVR